MPEPNLSTIARPVPELSIIMPAHNEEATIEAAIDRILSTEMPVDSELVVVDDGSRDRTRELVVSRDWGGRVRVVAHEVNRGKGAAMRTGVAEARGRYLAFMDADLEYDPEDIAKMYPYLQEDHTDAVFGTRMWQAHSAYSYWYVVGNRIINTTANILYNAWLSDVCAGVKLMPVELFRSLDLRENGFAIEAEMTARLLRRKARIFEVPIVYQARTREEGKKIFARDGLRILATFVRCRVS